MRAESLAGTDLHREGAPPNGVRFLDSGRKAVVHALWTFEIWNLASGDIERKLEIPESLRGSAWRVMPGEDRLLLSGRSGNLGTLNLDGSGHRSFGLLPRAVDFFSGESPGLGSFTSTIHADGTYEDTSTLYRAYSTACSIASSPDGERALLAYGQSRALLWNIREEKVEQSIGAEREYGRLDRIYRVALSPEGRFAASVHRISGLHVWDLATMRHVLHAPLRWRLPAAPDRPEDMPASVAELAGLGPVVFPPDSGLVAVADGNHVRLWDFTTQEELNSYGPLGESHPLLGDYLDMPRVHDLRFSAGGDRLLTVGVDATLRVFETGTRAQIWKARPAPCCVDWADIAGDGRRVVWAGCPGMRVFDLAV